MRRIALLGGSFNPFHNGHAAMAEAALDQLKPDELWLIPAKQPPHKPSYGKITDESRLEMLNAYAQKRDRVKVSTEELTAEGFTYTADTLERLNKRFPDYTFTFLIGGDSLAGFDRWYMPEKIVKFAEIAVCTREGYDLTAAKKLIEGLKESIGGRYRLLSFSNVDVSSTEVRKLIKSGKDFRHLVPAEIADCIEKNKLYSAENTGYSLKELEEKMQAALPDKRFKHVLGVRDTAVKMAERFGCDAEKAAKAALLHDCAKPLDAEILINLCLQNNIPVSEEEKRDKLTAGSLLHSKAGSVLARNIYYIEDEDILSAIYYHTVGRPEMTLLEKIIFTADFIEPSRTQPSDPPLEAIRQAAFENIDLAVFYTADSTVKYLTEKGCFIDPATVKTRDFYKNTVYGTK